MRRVFKKERMRACVCVSACVCVRERERGREYKMKKRGTYAYINIYIKLIIFVGVIKFDGTHEHERVNDERHAVPCNSHKQRIKNTHTNIVTYMQRDTHSRKYTRETRTKEKKHAHSRLYVKCIDSNVSIYTYYIYYIYTYGVNIRAVVSRIRRGEDREGRL